jgi:hypothetical protein
MARNRILKLWGDVASVRHGINVRTSLALDLRGWVEDLKVNLLPHIEPNGPRVRVANLRFC